MTKPKPETFPSQLLKQPVAERYQYFSTYSVGHTVLTDSFDLLTRTIKSPAGKQLIFVIGPPGTGKTFLMQWIEDEIKSNWAAEQHTDPGRIPFVGIEIPSKDRVNTSCSDIYQRILKVMEEPLIDKKVIYGDVALHRSEDGKVFLDSNATISKLRYALEQALKYRRPLALSLDEAQHLLDIAGLSLENIMDWLKSLANMTGVLFLLFGNYEMLDLIDLSDQLMRRSRIIHMRRYNKSGTDLSYFQSAVLAFQRNMPFRNEPDILVHSEFLYGRSVGCIGTLYEWLLAAYSLALDEEADTLTLKHLKDTAPQGARRAAKMNDSITGDEARFFKEFGEDEDEPPSLKGKGKRNKSVVGGAAGHQTNSPERKRNRRGKAWHRKPGRDKTGGQRSE